MLAIDRGPAQLQDLRPQRLIGTEIELLLGVVAEMARCRCTRLHPVRAHHAARRIDLRLVLHQQVLAVAVEFVAIQPGLVRALQPFAQFDIEDPEAQPAGGVAVFRALGKTQPVAANLGMNVRMARPQGGRRKQFGKGKLQQGGGSRDWLQRKILASVGDHEDSIRRSL